MHPLRGYVVFDSKPKQTPPNLNGVKLSYFDVYQSDQQSFKEPGVVISGETSRPTVHDVVSDLEKKIGFTARHYHLSLFGTPLNLVEPSPKDPCVVEVAHFRKGDLREHYTVLELKALPSLALCQAAMQQGDEVRASDVYVRSLPILDHPRTAIDFITPQPLDIGQLKAFFEQRGFAHSSSFSAYLSPK